MIPPMEYSWKAATVPALDPGANTVYVAIVVIKNPKRDEPYLESVVWSFWLGRQTDKHEAEKAFERLGFSLPSHAHVLIEERK